MIFPDKFTSIDESLLAKTDFLLSVLETTSEIEIIELYNLVEKHFDDIEDYLLALDLLYIVNRLEVTDGTINAEKN